jgi:hypothetical protein
MSNPSMFLERARKMLSDEYTQAHTSEYNTWLANHKNAWMQPHVVVPFPPFIVNAALAPFKSTVSSPTESDIVARATELYNQSNPEPVPTAAVAEPVVPIVAAVAAPDVVEQEPTFEDLVADPVVETVVEVQQVQEEEPVEETTVAEPVIEEAPPPTSGKLLSPALDIDTETKIHNIFKPVDNKLFKDPEFKSVTEDLDVIPQPMEELAKVDASGNSSSSFFQKLKDKWITK